MLKTTLGQWRMFRAVVEHGGFSQAGDAIHKSQSTIHHAVQKLEDSLGIKLLKVQGRKVGLTQAGELMLRRANYLLDEAAKLEAVATGLGSGTETQLKIAVDEVFPQNLLYRVLDTVSAQFPLLRIELMETVLSGAQELLEKAKVDIAISPVALTNGFNEEFCQIEFLAVANPSHALHQQEQALSFEDLKSHRQIVVRDSASSSGKDVGWLGADQRWTVSHVRTSIDMISQGFGYAWLPVPAIEQELQSGLLKPLPLAQGVKRTAQLYLCFADGDRLGPAARTFIGELRYQSESLLTAEQLGNSN
ncbi:LysR family transcriptional regulator [Bowmanella yangjiangensis]|uniref:LysR family transcriptional regulator n=1 Tax=Bowmanella yangjiangensis TaxID=2811230 RepID=A0ABS3CUI7_9ALTE|nr:LysR family transcriptional regulator [Bowmanella yangjiangensis]MBN7820787.1 LysR family transcriptional regulator [Bowmanella yangjiangensis]